MAKPSTTLSPVSADQTEPTSTAGGVVPLTPAGRRPRSSSSRASGRIASSGTTPSSSSYGGVWETAPLTAPVASIHQPKISGSPSVDRLRPLARAFSITVSETVCSAARAASNGPAARAYSSTSSVNFQLIPPPCPDDHGLSTACPRGGPRCPPTAGTGGLAWRAEARWGRIGAMMAAPVLVLIHSPLVGPLPWEPAADRLQALGYQVVVPSLHGAVGTSQPYYRKLASRVAQVIDEDPSALAGPLTLVGHSGAAAPLRLPAAQRCLQGGRRRGRAARLADAARAGQPPGDAHPAGGGQRHAGPPGHRDEQRLREPAAVPAATPTRWWRVAWR